jgi:pilus assembly protein Flp/PilA
MNMLLRLLREEDGPTAVEYAVMLAMIIMAAISAIGVMGQQTADSFDDTSGKLQGVFGGS